MGVWACVCVCVYGCVWACVCGLCVARLCLCVFVSLCVCSCVRVFARLFLLARVCVCARACLHGLRSAAARGHFHRAGRPCDRDPGAGSSAILVVFARSRGVDNMFPMHGHKDVVPLVKPLQHIAARACCCYFTQASQHILLRQSFVIPAILARVSKSMHKVRPSMPQIIQEGLTCLFLADFMR